MTRGDALGLALVLLAGLAGLAWVVGRAWPDAAPPGGGPPDAVAEARADGARRVALGANGEGAAGAPAARDDEWSRLNREAIFELEAGRLERAVELFDRCHAGHPEESVFASNLAEALARLARREHEERALRERALERLTRAVALDPARADLADLLRRWRELARAEADFWTDESLHFQLTYDGARQEILERGYDRLLEALEAGYLDLGELFGRFPVEDGGAKVQVVLYRRSEFTQLTGLGHWAGGVFDGVVRIPVENLGREEAGLKRVLRHELVHAFVQAVGGSSVPGWLNEGLAQWHEETAGAARRALVERARERLRGRELYPLESLRGSLASWQDTEAIGVAYAQSLALVAHLQRYYGERVLYQMVAGCARGSAPAETFRERTGVDLSRAATDLAGEL